MNKKQIIGLVAATVAFIVICSVSTLVHFLMMDASGLDWFLSGDYSYDYEDSYYEEEITELPEEDFIAQVNVEGDILRSSDMGYYDYDDFYYDHQGTLDYIDELKESENNKGILLYIDSPGGGVYESDELYLKLMEYKEETDRPIWTYMASEACSGGLYVAMAGDRIYCNRNGLTGSIGVLMTLSDYSEYMADLGISEINITSGVNKAMGSGTEKLTDEQKSIFQSLIDESYEQFVEIVATGRGMAVNQVKEIADGRMYSPKQALNLGLIDEIAAFHEVEEAFMTELGTQLIASLPENNLSVGDEFSTEGDSAQISAKLEMYKWLMSRFGSGRLMYYAKPTR